MPFLKKHLKTPAFFFNRKFTRQALKSLILQKLIQKEQQTKAFLEAQIGYKQELKKRFSTFQIFGIANSAIRVFSPRLNQVPQQS